MAVKKRQLTFIPDQLSFSDGKGALSKNRMRKAAWIFVIIVATGLLSFHLASLIIEYKEYLVSTVVKNHMFQFEFPNVTICRKRPFSVKKKPAGGIGVNSAMRFWMYALNMTDNAGNREEAFERAMASFEEYAYEKDIYNPIFDDFHMCYYMDAPCNLSDFYPTDFHGQFNCEVFAPKNRRFSRLGKHFGLRIVLSSGDNYGITSETEKFNLQEGYNIMIHDNAGDVMEVMPWHLVKIRLKMNKYKSVNTPTQPCYEDTDWVSSLRALIKERFPPEKYGECNLGNSLSEAQCLSIKKMTLGLKTCGCLPNSKTMPMPCSVKSMTSCHKLPKEFFYNNNIDSNGNLFYESDIIELRDSTKFQEIVKRVECFNENITLKKKEVFKLLDQSCPYRCVGLSYEATLTSNVWPDDRADMIDILSNLESEYHYLNRQKFMATFKTRNFSSIVIYPGTLNVEEVTQELAYPIVKLASDFGGTIGLWVGFSFLTLIEFIEIIFSLSVYNASKLKKKSNPTSPENPKEGDAELESLHD